MADKMKVNYFKTFLIGCGFLGSMVAWSIYDPYVSKLLSEKLTDSVFISNMGAKTTPIILGTFSLSPIMREPIFSDFESYFRFQLILVKAFSSILK